MTIAPGFELYPHYGPTAAPIPDYPVVDIHNHMWVAAAREIALDHFTPEKDQRIRFASAETTAYNRSVRARPELIAQFEDPEVRLGVMDDMGIDIQAVSIGPDQYFYWAEGELGPRLSRMQNDHLAEVVAAHPDRFVGLGTLPLQDPRAAVAEMERISRVHGFPGVSIGTSVAGRDFDLPEFQPLWEKAEELGILVVLHPYGFDAADRLGEYYLTNVVAMPLESTIAVSRMILGGVFERHPDLKLLIVHGGGYLPFYFARSDHAYRHRPELRANISRLPSEYLSMLYFDTCLHASHPVEHLVQHFGSDHVLLGTDYPYDMGVTDPLALLASADQLTDEDREKISGGNARGLLGLA